MFSLKIIMEKQEEKVIENQNEPKEVKDSKDLEIQKLNEKLNLLIEKVSSLEKSTLKKTDLKINFKTFSGKKFSLYADKSDKIADLKAQIQEKEKISPNQQYLFLDSQLLNDNSTINESNIKETSTIYLMKEQEEDGCLNFCPVKERLYFIESIRKNVFQQIKCLLYDARKDGDDANTFHKKCDEQGPLLYVIQTTDNKIFGIYVSKSLSSDNCSKTDSLQMVISPSNDFSIKSLSYHATYHCNNGQGARFHCMNVNTPFLSTDCSDIQSCTDFNLPCYPSGKSSYRIKELQVYALEEIA